MSEELVALLDGHETGRVVQDDRGRLSFTYNEAWRSAAHAYPLSILMLLAHAKHGNEKIYAFLWGPLPDN
jgi:serine/threonine-protein kinase HipA